jgi:hypothetical protein
VDLPEALAREVLILQVCPAGAAEHMRLLRWIDVAAPGHESR